MTEHSAATDQDRFLRAVQKELAEAERREREFSKVDRAERAAKLGIPTGIALDHDATVPASPRRQAAGRSDITGRH